MLNGQVLRVTCAACRVSSKIDLHDTSDVPRLKEAVEKFCTHSPCRSFVVAEVE